MEDNSKLLNFQQQLATRAEISQAKALNKSADVRARSDNAPATIQRIVLDLTTARTEGAPFKITFPFAGFYVEDATDSAVNVQLVLDTRDTRGIANYITLKRNDSADLAQVMSGGYLLWSAQSGKSITIVFFTDIGFRPGSQNSVNSGGVSINDGSAFSNATVTLAAAAATQLFAADSDRKVGSVINTTGATLYLGPSGVTATTGKPWPAGSELVWRNTAALYCYNPGIAADVVAMSEE